MSFTSKLAITATAVVAVIAVAPVAVAQADTGTGVITNGVPYTDSPTNTKYCTIGAVGTDAAGNKVAISAAHCISHLPDGATLYRYQPGGGGAAIGTIVSRGWYGAPDDIVGERDWVVIKLNSDAVLSSNGPGARITSTDTTGVRTLRDVVCKDGYTSGVTCGLVLTQDANYVFNAAYIGSGDSGGPAFTRNTAWVGINFGVQFPPGTRYLRAGKILADIQAGSNPVGKGFTITNTP